MDSSPPTVSEQLARLGKGLVQINLRLGQLAEGGERPTASAEGGKRTLEILLDLVDATGDALARREKSAEKSGGWFARWTRRGGNDEDLWRGVAMAHAAALERLRGMGVEPAPSSGAFDPALHRAVELRPTPSSELAGSIAAQHRPGWTRRSGAGREVLREAHVSVYEEKGS